MQGHQRFPLDLVARTRSKQRFARNQNAVIQSADCDRPCAGLVWPETFA